MSEIKGADEWYIRGGFETEFEKPVTGASNSIRFWMPKSSERKIVFLTNEPAVILYEHQVKIRDRYRNFATCMRMIGKECPLCNLDNNRYQAAAFTVIDCNKYTDKEGKEHKNVKRLFMAKGRTWEKLLRQHKRRVEAGESLRGACYLVARGNDEKSPSVGDDFEFIGMVDLAKLPDSAEFDYKEILKPNADLIKSYVAKLKNAESDEKDAPAGKPATDKTIPF